MSVATNSILAGSAAVNVSTQHLAYIGDGNRLYVLEFAQAGGPNPWTQWDILAFQQRYGQPIPPPIVGLDGPRGGCPLAVIPWDPPEINGLVYIGTSNGQSVIQALTLEMPGLQVPNTFNLTQLTNTQSDHPKANSPLTAFTWQKQQSLHVIYLDNQSHMRELYRVGTGPWYTNDLSAHTDYLGSSLPRANSLLAGYTWENQGTEHVVYIAQDGTIRELYYDGGWHGNNLSATRGALPPASNSPLAAYVCEYENTQHVIYVNANGDVQELYYSGGGWASGDPLNLQAGATKPASNSALAGYAAEYERTQHVVYVDDFSVMHEIYRSGNAWFETLLLESAGSNAIPPRYGTPLAGYAYLYANVGTQHVIYVDVNNNVHELYREGNAWHSGVVSGSIPISS